MKYVKYRWDLGRECTGVILVVKELGFPNVRSVVALPNGTDCTMERRSAPSV
jgi:hypothetical protein